MPLTLIINIILWLIVFVVISASSGNSDPAGSAMAAGFAFLLVFLPIAIYSTIVTIFLCSKENLAKEYKLISLACSMLIIPAYLLIEGII